MPQGWEKAGQVWRAERMPYDQDEVGKAGCDQAVASLAGQGKGNRRYSKYSEDLKGFLSKVAP